MFSSQLHTVYKETKWFKIAAFFQTLFSEWKPYMANFVCKKWFLFLCSLKKKEKMLLKLVVQRILSPLDHIFS